MLLFLKIIQICINTRVEINQCQMPNININSKLNRLNHACVPLQSVMTFLCLLSDCSVLRMFKGFYRTLGSVPVLFYIKYWYFVASFRKMAIPLCQEMDLKMVSIANCSFNLNLIVPFYSIFTSIFSGLRKLFKDILFHCLIV